MDKLLVKKFEKSVIISGFIAEFLGRFYRDYPVKSDFPRDRDK